MVKKKLAKRTLESTLKDVDPNDILELDEMWSFVQCAKNKVWLWLALCRRTRQIVGYYLGKRDDDACRKLKENISVNYKHCNTVSDYWKPYKTVFNQSLHESVGKATGKTNHIERFNNTVRQRLSRYVRKTLSFSKSYDMHDIVTRYFIIQYNLTILPVSYT